MNKLIFCPFSESALPVLKDMENLLYISPSGRKSAEIKAELSNCLKGSEFYSLDRFVEQLLKNSKKYADDKFKLVLIQELISSSREYGPLFNNSPGSVSVLVELVSDLKNYGYGRDIEGLRKQLAFSLEGYEKVSRRALFAVSIFEKYQKALSDLGYADDIDRLENAAELLKKKKFTQETLVLDGFFDMPKGQQVFFEALLALFSKVIVIHYGDERLDEIGNVNSEFLECVQKERKFLVTKIVPARPARFPVDIPVHKASSVEEEVAEIARSIKKLAECVKDPGTIYKDVIVTFPSMFSYVPYVKRIFPAYGIPFSASLDVPLGSLPQIFPAGLLLKSMLSGYSRRSVVDVVSSPAFKMFSPTTRELFSSVTRLGSITGGRLQWEELKERLENEEPDYLEKMQKELKILFQELKEYLSLMAPLERDSTLLDFAREFRKSLKKSGFAVTGEERAKAFNDLFFSIEKMLAAVKGKKNTLSENARLFISLLDKVHFREELPVEGVVRILGVLETRGLECLHLYFGGLSDGDFPVRPKQEMIIPDKVRRELGLIDFSRRIELQKHHFFRLLQTPAKEIHLSYSAQKDEKLTFPSNFLPESMRVKVPELVEPLDFKTEEVKQREAGRKVAGSLAPGFFRIDFSDKNVVGKYIRSIFSEGKDISVTALDRYLDCPRIFYLEKVLGFDLLKEPGFEVESAKLGTIMHDIMEGLFIPGKKNMKALPGRLKISSEKELLKSAIHPFWKEHVALRLGTLLKRLVKQEDLLAKDYPSVYCIERKGRILLPGTNVGVKGRLDRVDTNNHGFMVIDYKTGNGAVRCFEKTKNGESVQLPLYARMVSVEQPNLFVSGLCIYDLKEGKLRLIKKEDILNLYESALVTASYAIKAILNGDFPEKEKKSGCYTCRYAAICGK